MRHKVFLTLFIFLIILSFALPVSAAGDEAKTETGGTAAKAKPQQFHSSYKYVALTFDDGPSDYLAPFLNELARTGARVTFIPSGRNIPKYSSVLERATMEGHQVGSHCYSHTDLTTMSDEEIKDEVAKTRKLIEDNTWMEDWEIIVRPPYGFRDQRVLNDIDAVCFGWSIDTYDWAIKDSDDLSKRIRSAKDGDIVLCHITVPTTPKGVIDAISKMEKQGYRFVTLNQLAEIKGADLQEHRLYKSFNKSSVKDMAPKAKVEDILTRSAAAELIKNEFGYENIIDLNDPEGCITREEFAAAIYDIGRNKGAILAADEDLDLYDYELVQEWAQDAVMAVSSLKLMNPREGMNGLVFEPGKYITEAEALIVVDRMKDFLEKSFELRVRALLLITQMMLAS